MKTYGRNTCCVLRVGMWEAVSVLKELTFLW